MCSMDCLNCTLPDCENDNLTQAERKEQDELDREVIGSRKYGRSLVVWNYQHSEKGKSAQAKYNASEKGKERNRRYIHSEKGKAVAKKKKQKCIENGKNAEYCRRYYQRKKERKNES